MCMCWIRVQFFTCTGIALMNNNASDTTWSWISPMLQRDALWIPAYVSHDSGWQWSWLGFACVDVHLFVAVSAVDSAAPLELALALGGAAHTGSVIAPPTTHDLTAVGSMWSPVAHAPTCAHWPFKRRDRHTQHKHELCTVSYLKTFLFKYFFKLLSLKKNFKHTTQGIYIQHTSLYLISVVHVRRSLGRAC